MVRLVSVLVFVSGGLVGGCVTGWWLVSFGFLLSTWVLGWVEVLVWIGIFVVWVMAGASLLGFNVTVVWLRVLVVVVAGVWVWVWLVGLLLGVQLGCPVRFGVGLQFCLLPSLVFSSFSNISSISFCTFLPLGFGLGFVGGLGGLGGAGFPTAAVASTQGVVGWGLSCGPISVWYNFIPILFFRPRRISPPSS